MVWVGNFDNYNWGIFLSDLSRSSILFTNLGTVVVSTTTGEKGIRSHNLDIKSESTLYWCPTRLGGRGRVRRSTPRQSRRRAFSGVLAGDPFSRGRSTGSFRTHNSLIYFLVVINTITTDTTNSHE